MQFETQQQFDILPCRVCGARAFIGAKRCKECKSMMMAMQDNNKILYYGAALSDYHIRIKRARARLHVVQLLFALIFSFGFFALFVWLLEKNDFVDVVFTFDFWFRDVIALKGLFWFAVISFSYLLYRLSQMGEEIHEIIYRHDKPQSEALHSLPLFSSWSDIHKISHKQKENIALYFTDDAKRTLEQAFVLGQTTHAREVTIYHLLHSLMQSTQIRNIFVRLGVSTKTFDAHLAQLLAHVEQSQAEPVLSRDVIEIIFHAYAYTKEKHDSRVRSTQLLLASVLQSEQIQEILYDMNISAQKLISVIEWVRRQEQEYEKYRVFRRAAARMSKHGIDRAMTAVATPYLNQFSTDLTLAAKFGRVEACVGRDKELQEIFRVVESGRGNVMLVGERGVGKLNIIGGLVQRMIAYDVPALLQDKRLVQISNTALLAGTTVAGAQERLMRMVGEVKHAGNIILFINNIHDLVGTVDNAGQGLDVSEALAEYLSGGDFIMFATSVPDAYKRHIARTEIGGMFSRIDIPEMNEIQAIQVLESKASYVEYKQRVFFSYDAVERCVVYAHKFFYDQTLPESAINLMTEVAVYTRSQRGEHSIVGLEDVATVVSDKTGIPTTSLSQNESEKLMRLEEEMHKRVIGQDMAVTMLAQALRRARAELQNEHRPIANFLFLGPTGVGKTELAKTIAEVYFGGEERMIRLDMSEYQDISSIYRLIGESGKQGSGILTEAVREQAFSLVLLDELEKAHKDVLNIFLQVFDDGRLTDSVGRVVNFNNTIIIATSNAGTAYVQEQMRQGVDIETIHDHLMRQELRNYYRPEFLNRFDGVILFKALTRPEIKQIAGLMMKKIEKDLEERGVLLRIEDTALESLADVGFDPDFGARPMRRAIQDRVENQLADLILQNKLKRRDVVVLGEACQIRVERN